MESDVVMVFLEYGALGLFAGFLVWQHLSMQKRLDKLVDKFQLQLNSIQEKYEVKSHKQVRFSVEGPAEFGYFEIISQIF